jgi:SAM-dependent methyltransferase
VLCYTENPQKILENLSQVLEPGGLLFCSVEARLGWACALDVAPGGLEALWGDGVVHVPGDRWIHCYTELEFRALFEGWELLQFLPTHYLPSGPFEAAAGDLPIDEVAAWEDRFRQHPDLACLNRAWIAVARWPDQR